MVDTEMLQALEMLLDKKLEPIKEELKQIKEDTEITREATNYIGSKFESLVNILEETGVIAPHSI